MSKWCFLFFPTFLYSSYVGNPASPGLMQTGLFSVHNYLLNISTGYVHDISWDKKIVFKKSPKDVFTHTVKEFHVVSDWTALSLTFLRKLSFYSYLGVSKETMKWTFPVIQSSPAEIETRHHFSYSVGAAFLLLQLPSLQIGLDAQYSAIPSTDKLVKQMGLLYWMTGLSYEEISLEEWHVALAVIKSLGPFSAYVGGKYGEKKLEIYLNKDKGRLVFREKYPAGIFTGASLNFSRSFYLNIEGRFLDEYALSFAAIAAF